MYANGDMPGANRHYVNSLCHLVIPVRGENPTTCQVVVSSVIAVLHLAL